RLSIHTTHLPSVPTRRSSDLFGESLRRLLAAAKLPEGAEDQMPRDLRLRLEEPGNREMVQMLGDLTPAEQAQVLAGAGVDRAVADRKSTRLNSSHVAISYAVF